MQPAAADVVQNLTLPDSTATAGAFASARMSLPWCVPPARGCAEVVAVRDRADRPGRRARGTDFAGAAFAPAASASMTMTTATIRMVRGPTFGTLADDSRR